MPATLLDGTVLLDTVKHDLRVRIKRLAEQGITPGLGTILVGDDPNSHAYVRLKREDSAEIGVRSVHTELPATTKQSELLAVIIQPGGSVGDEKNITRADELGVAMVFTGERHFLH